MRKEEKRLRECKYVLYSIFIDNVTYVNLQADLHVLPRLKSMYHVDMSLWQLFFFRFT